MKITQISLIFSIVAIFSSAIAASGQNAPVLDINGEVVRVGESYYIVSSIFGAGGGGLTVSPFGCPGDVVQEWSDLQNGKPLRFHPVDPNDDVVRVSTDLNIEFDPFTSVNPCPQSLVWTLDFSAYMRTNKVTTGGVVGNPGANTINNWFKIENGGPFYRLVYNPTVSDDIPTFTGDLGINIAFGQRHLILTSSERAFGFFIIKAGQLTAGGRPFINIVTKA